jgi:tetratricopeptide (TPR) repeat protein
MIENSPWWTLDVLGDAVELRWIENLVASGEIGREEKAIGQLKFNLYRPDAQMYLAVAYAEAKNTARASEHFTRAVDAASNLGDESECSKALQKIAGAQVTVGMADGAKTTIRRLIETVDFVKEPSAKLSALREAAVVAAKAHDEQTAHRLFERAIEAQKTVGGTDGSDALKEIAAAQAGVGFLNDALKTTSLIKSSVGDREAALYALAVAQGKTYDFESAVRTALSVKHYDQYHDGALQMIAHHQIAKRDPKAALATAQNIKNPSEKAAAILKVATAQAKSGDRKTAADIAARIELTPPEDSLALFEKKRFDYRLPDTWGFRYDDHSFFTMGLHQMSTERAVKVASAAMELSLALGQQPEQSYAILFNEIKTGEIIQALARTHAASGNPNEALTWAKQIGGNAKVK